MSPPTSRSILVERLRAAGCVFAEDEARLLTEEAGSPAELAAMVDRRVAGVPLEHVLGWVEFCGLRIEVDPGVFVPRRRTEGLVREAAAVAGPGALMVDLCCGSGAVGAALVRAVGGVTLLAADVDPAAVRCARRNVEPLGGEVCKGDLYEPLPASVRGLVDVLVVNAPYVPTAAIELMPPEARLYEPMAALDGGFDGLDVHRSVAAGAPIWLAPGGHLLIETSKGQVARAIDILVGHGLIPQVATSDELNATVVIGTKPFR
ncbi:MAG: putative protein N(5)-glutamine methyltransferase [Nocardioidaceae bacterium]